MDRYCVVTNVRCLAPGMARSGQIWASLTIVIESKFAETASFTVGVEEELMVLDAESLALAPRAAELIAAAEGQTSRAR